MTKLDLLAERALLTGCAIGEAALQDLVAQASKLEWQPVAIRSGEGQVAQLKPQDKAAAHPRSLSALVGKGEQPLHTDGAHLKKVPDVIVLHSSAPNVTPTLVHDPGEPSEAQLNGIFTVVGAKRPFLTTAYERNQGWRYDPGCMTPSDAYARLAVSEFTAMSHNAHKYEWTRPNMVLVIANRKVLHARAQVQSQEPRTIHRMAFRLPGVMI